MLPTGTRIETMEPRSASASLDKWCLEWSASRAARYSFSGGFRLHQVLCVYPNFLKFPRFFRNFWDLNMNPSPKRYEQLVVLRRKMEPLGVWAVLGVLNVWNREYWAILWCGKNFRFFPTRKIFFRAYFKIQMSTLQRNSVYRIPL